MNAYLNRFHLRHIDPPIIRTDAGAMIAGLFAVLALELGVTGRELLTEEVLTGFVQIDVGLLQGN